jgi:hypothetical protein
VPLLIDFAHNELEKQILSVELVRQDVSKPYLAPPNVPPANLAVLRGAFHSCLEDAEFTAEVKQRDLDIDRPMDAEELHALVTQISQTPAAPWLAAINFKLEASAAQTGLFDLDLVVSLAVGPVGIYHADRHGIGADISSFRGIGEIHAVGPGCGAGIDADGIVPLERPAGG